MVPLSNGASCGINTISILKPMCHAGPLQAMGEHDVVETNVEHIGPIRHASIRQVIEILSLALAQQHSMFGRFWAGAVSHSEVKIYWNASTTRPALLPISIYWNILIC